MQIIYLAYIFLKYLSVQKENSLQMLRNHRSILERNEIAKNLETKGN